MEDDICEAFRELFTKHWANCLGTTCVIGSDKQESIFNLTFVFEYLRVHWSVLGKKNSISVCPWWGRKKKKNTANKSSAQWQKVQPTAAYLSGLMPDFEDLGGTDFWKPVSASWNHFQLSFLAGRPLSKRSRLLALLKPCCVLLAFACQLWPQIII